MHADHSVVLEAEVHIALSVARIEEEFCVRRELYGLTALLAVLHERQGKRLLRVKLCDTEVLIAALHLELAALSHGDRQARGQRTQGIEPRIEEERRRIGDPLQVKTCAEARGTELCVFAHVCHIYCDKLRVIGDIPDEFAVEEITLCRLHEDKAQKIARLLRFFEFVLLVVDFDGKTAALSARRADMNPFAVDIGLLIRTKNRRVLRGTRFHPVREQFRKTLIGEHHANVHHIVSVALRKIEFQPLVAECPDQLIRREALFCKRRELCHADLLRHLIDCAVELLLIAHNLCEQNALTGLAVISIALGIRRIAVGAAHKAQIIAVAPGQAHIARVPIQ